MKNVSINPNALVSKAVRVVGCIDAHFAESYEIMQGGWVKESQVVSHTFPLEQVTQAFETAVNTKDSIKVMIEP